MARKAENKEASASVEPEVSGAALEMSHEQAAEHAAKDGVKVQVAALDKDGAPIVNKGVYKTIRRAVTAEDILQLTHKGSTVGIVTVDGQKLEIAV